MRAIGNVLPVEIDCRRRRDWLTIGELGVARPKLFNVHEASRRGVLARMSMPPL